MARYKLLNNVEHKDLRIVTRFGGEFGDQVGMVPAYPTEYAELQREYPIFFRKDPDNGQYHSVVLLGFSRDENLFLQGDTWNAGYVPGHVAKDPFAIGFQERRVDGELREEPVIHVDMEHPRVSFDEGQPVFLPQGGNSPYLEHVITVLQGIRDGVEGGKAMYEAFDSLELIQPTRLDIKLDEEHSADITGLLSIDRERLAALDADSIYKLHRSGFLEGAYLVLASQHNLRQMVAEKQRRIGQEEGSAN